MYSSSSLCAHHAVCLHIVILHNHDDSVCVFHVQHLAVVLSYILRVQPLCSFGRQGISCERVQKSGGSLPLLLLLLPSLLLLLLLPLLLLLLLLLLPLLLLLLLLLPLLLLLLLHSPNLKAGWYLNTEASSVGLGPVWGSRDKTNRMSICCYCTLHLKHGSSTKHA